MGSGASSKVAEGMSVEMLTDATAEELVATFNGLPEKERIRLKSVVDSCVVGKSSDSLKVDLDTSTSTVDPTDCVDPTSPCSDQSMSDQNFTNLCKNQAFVFIKPNALTDKFKDFICEKFAAVGVNGIRIIAEGDLAGEVIDEQQLVDQHYYAIASKATLLKPSQLNVPLYKFKDFFGVDWTDVLASGSALNATDAMERLGIDYMQLDALWQAAMKKQNAWVKLGGGFQCGKIEAEGKDPVYTFNGFFLSMRAKFTQPGPSIHYYVVEWDPKDLSWSEFRNDLLGATDPGAAQPESLRGKLFTEWQNLGLKEKPWIGENGIHASASPFEALAERCNWLGRPLSEDDFGKELLNAGIPRDTLEAWRLDPQVVVAKGGKGGVFDELEDLDHDDCIAKCVEISKLQT